MIATLLAHLPWLLSVITLFQLYLAGNKDPRAWLVGIANQMVWLLWIVVTSTWGFLPLTVGICAVYLRNHYRWNLMDVKPVVRTTRDPT